MNTLIVIILSLIIVFTPFFIFLWKEYLKVYVEKQWILRKVKILYKAYSKACMNVYSETIKTIKLTDNYAPLTIYKNTGTYIDKVDICNGLCAAVHCITKTTYEKGKILDFLAEHIEICDLKWKTLIGAVEGDFELYKELEQIHKHAGKETYWFPAGDVISRRDFLKRVLIQKGKLKD